MSKFNLYLWTRLDDVKALFVALIILSIITAAVSGVVLGEARTQEALDIAMTILIGAGITVVMNTILVILTPTSRDVALIWGLESLTNNKELAKLPDNVIKATNNYLEGLQPKPEEKE